MKDSLSVVDIKLDDKPAVEVELDFNRYERNWDELKDDFTLPLLLADDYGIERANVVATLSRGEGEAVKFREMKWPIKTLNSGAKRQRTKYHIKLDTLSMTPGDELYFFIELWDNKRPNPQRTKSDVYFLSIADTITRRPTTYEGLALSVEAEYFKSQRQIIIDAEKLIANRNELKQAEFKSQSNLIGDDQKILRLRYGVFLGEEFTTTGGLGQIDHSGHDHSMEGVHDHDSDAEENKSSGKS